MHLLQDREVDEQTYPALYKFLSSTPCTKVGDSAWLLASPMDLAEVCHHCKLGLIDAEEYVCVFPTEASIAEHAPKHVRNFINAVITS